MNRQRIQLILISLLLVSSISCKQMFTTSLAQKLARNSISISSKTSINTLLDIAAAEGSSDPSVAKAVLEALGGKTAEEIKALTPEEKTAILNLAPSASINMSSITDLAKKASLEGANTDELVEEFFQNFDSTADLSAIETILGDTANLDSLPADSLVFASAVVAATLAAEIPAADLLALLSGEPSDIELTEAQQAKIDLITGVKDNLAARDAEGLSGIDIGGFNLLDLLGS